MILKEQIKGCESFDESSGAFWTTEVQAWAFDASEYRHRLDSSNCHATVKKQDYTKDDTVHVKSVHVVIHVLSCVKSELKSMQIIFLSMDHRWLNPSNGNLTSWLTSCFAGNLNSNGNDLLIYGQQYGNVFIGVQPTFGYEGDPMRLLFSRSASPHHGFAAFYTYLEKIFKADACLHFGTHGR